jgi:hypothetical protein
MNSKAIRAFSVRRIIAILAGVAVALGITVATASSATAAPRHHHRPHCASQADYRAVHIGQTKQRVQRELGNRGVVIGSSGLHGYRGEALAYWTCAGRPMIQVFFYKHPHRLLRVISKHQSNNL